MQLEPAHKDNKKARALIRQKIYSVFPEIYNFNCKKDIINTVEDYYLPSIVYFFLSEKKSDFLKDLDLSSNQYLNINNRVGSFIKILQSENLYSADHILGDIHPFSSTKVLIGNKIKYKKYPDYYNTLENLLRIILPDYKNYLPNIERDKDTILREYIEVNKYTEKDSLIEEYYYNLGRFLPILLLLRAIDINAENILINLPYPIFFDLESIFSGEFKDNIEEYSLKNTGIIKLTELNDSSVLTGGLGHKNSFLKPIITITDGLPNIKWKVPSKGSYDNIPILRNNPVNPSKYLESIISGYNSSVEKILNSKESLLNIIGSNLTTYTRVILRPTRIYRLIILKSFYPQIYLNNKVEEYIKGEIEKNNFLYKINSERIEAFEAESLENLLVPVFYSNIFGHELFFPNDEIVGRMNKTQFELWQEYLKKTINRTFFSKQQNLLQDSLKQ